MSAITPTPLGVVTAALGRTPTPQELYNLAPIAVMVQSFCASASDNDTLQLQCEQWSDSFLFGLIDTNGQRISLTIEKGSYPPPDTELSGAASDLLEWMQQYKQAAEVES